MYLTDIRGFTAQEYYICPASAIETLLAYGDTPIFAAKAKQMCKITIHGMGMLGDKGLSLHFARFCNNYQIEPRFLRLSDMGISFFVESCKKDAVLDALCEYFPLWG